MTTLTKEAILELMGNSRNRGGYERCVKNFEQSGEPHTDNLMEDIEFQGKEITTVYNSLNRNAKPFPNIKALYDKERNLVVLVNLALINATDEAEAPEDES